MKSVSRRREDEETRAGAVLGATGRSHQTSWAGLPLHHPRLGYIRSATRDGCCSGATYSGSPRSVRGLVRKTFRSPPEPIAMAPARCQGVGASARAPAWILCGRVLWSNFACRILSNRTSSPTGSGESPPSRKQFHDPPKRNTSKNVMQTHPSAIREDLAPNVSILYLFLGDIHMFRLRSAVIKECQTDC